MRRVLLSAGAIANPAIWEDAIRARAKGVLQAPFGARVFCRAGSMFSPHWVTDDGVRRLLESARTPPVRCRRRQQAFSVPAVFSSGQLALSFSPLHRADPALARRVENGVEEAGHRLLGPTSAEYG